MNKQIKLQIINLAKFVFDEDEYFQFNYYLQKNQLHDMRLFIAEKLEHYELQIITMSFHPDNEIVLLQQYKYCNELEDIVMHVLEITV